MISGIDRIIVELSIDLVYVDWAVSYVEESYKGIPKDKAKQVAYDIIKFLIQEDLAQAETYHPETDSHSIEVNKAKVLGIIKHHFETDEVDGYWFNYVLFSDEAEIHSICQSIFQTAEWQQYGLSHSKPNSLYINQSPQEITNFEIAKFETYLLDT